MHNLVLLFPDSRIEIGEVPVGATTQYFDAPEGVYNYAAYQYELDGQTIQQPVIDCVGESPREGQDFTNVIQYDPSLTDMQRVILVEVIDED